jgi:hypothetical protein
MKRFVKQALSLMALGLQRSPLWTPTRWLTASRYLRNESS